MPELPEVQTVCDVIGPQIVGRKIEDAFINHEGVLANMDREQFKKEVCASSFLSVRRRGKYILLSLSCGKTMIVHLRMTGCLLVVPKGQQQEKHTHVVFDLDGEKELRFIDQRRFGKIWIVREGESILGLDALGPEPFDDEVTFDYLKKHLQNSHRKIKDCLLDQSFIAGIGNIYSDEILFRAGIHPAKCACRLTDDEVVRLAQIIPETMAYYVEKNCIDQDEYLRTGGREYQNTPFLQVYGRRGQKCLSCDTLLQKERVAGRGSVFCPNCQKLDETD